MDRFAQELLMTDQVKEIDPNALYILIRSPSGALLEDLTPLLASLEATYRKLFILRLDEGVRQLLYRRQKEEIGLHGVSRSINFRYQKLTVSIEQEYTIPTDQKRRLILELPTQLNLMGPEDQNKKPRGPTSRALFNREYMPHRIELARSRISSPGFIELIGDPQTLTILVALLGYLLLESHHRRQHLLALRTDQRETTSILISMGYSKEEIASVTQYLSNDLSEILRKLEESKAQLAPGDGIDPSLAARGRGLSPES